MLYTSDSIVKITEALVTVQKDIDPILKNKKASFATTTPGGKMSYTYANLEQTVAHLKPILPNNGLAYTQVDGVNDVGNECLITILMHTSGEWIRSYTPIEDFKKLILVAGKQITNPLQDYGKIKSFIRRYALTAICGLATEDEDNDGADLAGKGNKNGNGKEEKVKPHEEKATYLEEEKKEKDLVDKLNDDHLAKLRKLCNESAVSTTAFCEALGIRQSEPLTVLDAIDNFSSKLAEYRSKTKK